MIVDTHCHLDYFTDTEVIDLVGRARDVGIEKMITISTDISKFDRILKYTKDFSKTVYCSIGQHPCNVDDFSFDAGQMANIIESFGDAVVGVGETGLDYFHSLDNEHIARQKRSLKMHIEIAARYDLPLIIHNRNSDDDVYEILKKGVEEFGCRGLIHCFTAAEDFMQKMIDLGFYISIAGIVTFKNATELQNIVKKIPLNRLLIETDSPYLAPVPNRGKKNEPSFIRCTADFLADHLGILRPEFDKITTQNALKVFNLT